jgi:ATP-dependent RNA helicase DeaD
VGHIDLLDTISYFEVPERDARKVMSQLTGIRFKGRQVRCNDADDTSGYGGAGGRSHGGAKPGKRKADSYPREENDWRSLMQQSPRRLRGEEPDFSEEGWARRKPKKRHP